MAIPRHDAEQYYGQVYCDSDEVAELESELERVKEENRHLMEERVDCASHTAELAAMKEKVEWMKESLNNISLDDSHYELVDAISLMRNYLLPSPPSVQPKEGGGK